MSDNEQMQLDPQEAPEDWINQEEFFRRAGVSAYTGRIALKESGLKGRKRLSNRKPTYYDPAWIIVIQRWALNH